MPAPSDNPARVLSFTEHLEELRVRLIICIVWFALAFGVSLFFAPRIVGWLIAPLTQLEEPSSDRRIVLRMTEAGEIGYAGVATAENLTVSAPLTTDTLAGLAADRFRLELPFGLPPIEAGGGKPQSRLYYLSPIEPIMLLIKGALLSSLVFSLPMFVYQFWLFTAPGLMRRERKVVKWILSSSLLLFPAGAMFAYLISEICLRFLIAFGDDIPGLTPNIVASKYVGFILGLMLVFGVLFEFPLVLVLLSRLGVIDSAFLVRRRKLAIVIISVVAAVATPSPDPFTMVLMLLPLIGLYEGSIWTIRMLERAGAAEESLALRQKSVDA